MSGLMYHTAIRAQRSFCRCHYDCRFTRCFHLICTLVHPCSYFKAYLCIMLPQTDASYDVHYDSGYFKTRIARYVTQTCHLISRVLWHCLVYHRHINISFFWLECRPVTLLTTTTSGMQLRASEIHAHVPCSASREKVLGISRYANRS